MVVDDNEDIREGFRALLTLEGYEVICCEDGRSALEHLGSGAPLPGLVFLDLMMPGMDGYTYLELRAKDERLRKIPVVVITAGIEERSIMGVPVLQKSLEPGKLVSLIGRYGHATA